MATNPNAIFQTALSQIPQTQVYNPFTTQAEQAQTANLTQEAQQRQLQNQQTARTIKNLNTMRQSLPGLLQASGGKWDDSVYSGLINAGMDADQVEKVRSQKLGNDATLAATEKTRQDLIDAQAKHVDALRVQHGRVAEQLAAAKNPDGTYDEMKIAAVLHNAKANDPNFDEAGWLTQVNKPGFDARVQSALQMAPEIEQQRATAKLTGGQAEEASALASKARTEAQQAQFNLELQRNAASELQGGLNAGVPGVAGIPPGVASYLQSKGLDPKQPEFQEAFGQYRAAIMHGEGLKAADDAVNKIVDAAASARRELAREKTLIPLRGQQQTRTAIATEEARARLAPGAVGGIQSAAIQQKAINEEAAAYKDFQAKETDANRLLDTVDEIKKGNQEASSFARLEEVRSIVNRVSRYELSAKGQSAVRGLENWLSTKTRGRPTDATLDDITNLANDSLDRADGTYGANVDHTNRTLGSKFPLQPIKARRAGGDFPITAPNGKTYHFQSQQDAEAFRLAAHM